MQPIGRSAVFYGRFIYLGITAVDEAQEVADMTSEVDVDGDNKRRTGGTKPDWQVLCPLSV